MLERSFSNIFNAKSRFYRSVHLERDFTDNNALNGYVLTDFSKQTFQRLTEGLSANSGLRAWRITGDYGSGKSSFALFLASAFSRFSSLPQHIRSEINVPRVNRRNPAYVPLLCTCTRKPLSTTILDAVKSGVNTYLSGKQRTNLLNRIEFAYKMIGALADEAVLDILQDFNAALLKQSESTGTLLIIDELGKYLEFATVQSNSNDVYLLQKLAETASRSAEQPIFIVCLLHQGFNAYAELLNPSAQREWEKVAGRFEEIVFNQPLEQIGELIATAMNVQTQLIPKGQVEQLKKSLDTAIKLSWFGASNRSTLNSLIQRLYPLHPTVLPLLIQVFRRFGQNERSLFSFLFSNEPFGLQEFCARPLASARPYCLFDLYDYVRTNFGHKLTVQSYRSHWNLIDSVVDSYTTEDVVQVQVLKTIGLINLLNDSITASEESVLCTFAGSQENYSPLVTGAISELLNKRKTIYNRGAKRGLCLWPHTSVDIEKAYEDSKREVQQPLRVAAKIADDLTPFPLVARRHYISTGNLRYFEVKYLPVDDLEKIDNENDSFADGIIVIPLCETKYEYAKAIEFAENGRFKKRVNCLIGVPQPLNHLAGLVYECDRWNWVATNVPELSGDRYAREEVLRQLRTALTQLENGVQARIGLKEISTGTGLEWYNRGHKLNITNNRQLRSILSDILDDTYPKSPFVLNELVNRNSLSAAAAAARMRLIKLMLQNSSLPWLGMDPSKKPPEMSIYLSLLSRSGIHRKQDDEKWIIGSPLDSRSDRCKLRPAFAKISEVISHQPDNKVRISHLFDILRAPPFGVREGIFPILLTVFALEHEQDVAFYKDGTFLRELDYERMFELTKFPERFDIQYCKIEGVRSELYVRLLDVLSLKKTKEDKVDILDVVRPLCVFVAKLPPFVLNTKQCSQISLNVRDRILNAREPGNLLFTDLPLACGHNPIRVDEVDNNSLTGFIDKLKYALDELRASYPDLLERMKHRLREAFDIPGTFQEFRKELANQSENVVIGVKEPQLRAFCLRLLDDSLPDDEWLESIGSFLALKPPSKWHDSEEELFAHELTQLTSRYRRVESIVFAQGNISKNAIGVRIAVTQASGLEKEMVVHYSSDEVPQLETLQGEFEALLVKNKRLGLIAASRAIWLDAERKDQK